MERTWLGTSFHTLIPLCVIKHIQPSDPSPFPTEFSVPGLCAAVEIVTVVDSLYDFKGDLIKVFN